MTWSVSLLGRIAKICHTLFRCKATAKDSLFQKECLHVHRCDLRKVQILRVVHLSLKNSAMFSSSVLSQ